MVKALNSGLNNAMERDDSIILLGEDVGTDGGVFRVTEGLISKYGKERVMDTPLAELGIGGFGIGMSMAGLKAIPEIQFQDFIYTATGEGIFTVILSVITSTSSSSFLTESPGFTVHLTISPS